MAGEVVGFIGGTGPQGLGLALRIASTGHPVVIGSRDPARGEELARSLLGEHGDLPVRGADNAEAVNEAEVVFLTVPWEGHLAALQELGAALGGKILVDVVNPLDFDDLGPYSLDVDAGSAAEAAQTAVPDARVVSAFHDVSANLLQDPTSHLDTDILICGDDSEAKEVVLGLVDEVPGLRGIDVGPLRLSRHLEGLTAVLLSINRLRKAETGLRITGI